MDVLGTAAALALLEAAPKQGHAAVAILKCADSGRFVWQRKTPGYPVPSQVGGLCLFGGNREDADASARATLERELAEELGPEVAETLTPFARFIVVASPEIMAPRPAYSFTCCVFAAMLPAAPAATAEGVLEAHSLDELGDERFCWAYDAVFNTWLTEVDGAEGGAGVKGPAEWLRCSVLRLAPDANVGEWAGGEGWR
mmetsp:Transcript_2969/g.9918  ORF Transcript_2969/g.9918 Transcript_2969/m.9918 type:complete len:199 (-) Transcript_2969:47-643(-)